MSYGNMLFEIDRSLDSPVDEIEEQAEKHGSAFPNCWEGPNDSVRPKAKS
jgi:hypothetical protein